MAETTLAILKMNGMTVRIYTNYGATIWVSAGLDKCTDPMLLTRLGLDELHQLGAINLASTIFASNMVKDNADLKEQVRVLTEQRNKFKMAEELKRETPVPMTLPERIKAAVDILKS